MAGTPAASASLAKPSPLVALRDIRSLDLRQWRRPRMSLPCFALPRSLPSLLRPVDKNNNILLLQLRVKATA
uniref:Uncharacterized protein n=1 Tax=Oryza nivara TaxID=4536 RepID=A0A0E0I0B3_ORYNI